MENIRQAVERARAHLERPINTDLNISMPRAMQRLGVTQNEGRVQELELDSTYLQSHRIVAYDGKDPRSRPFDVLRTEVLRSMDLKGWKTLAVTSPTPGCGKTSTAVNLALSMARQPERHVCLVDLDLRKPQVAAILGLKRPGEGVLDVIEGRTDADSAIILARIGSSRLKVLPTSPCPDSSDVVASAAMRALLKDLGAKYSESRIVILDLPPLLTGHDVISILPHVDCVLLVAAVGTSKISEIEECYKYLEGVDVVRVVLNKVPESSTSHAYY
jgi:protein-tyrosine kinase